MRGLSGCFLTLLSFAALLVVGCGDGRETHFDEGTIVPTHTENVRGWLEGVAQSGQLDSGADVMRDEITGMKEEGAANADALLADFDQLVKTQAPAGVKAKATEMLKKLPPPTAAAPGETNT